MSTDHPYRSAPRSSFWSSFVDADFATRDLAANMPAGLQPGAAIVSAGSCFAANMVPYLERRGFVYVREEYQAPLYRNLPPENLSYGKFSAGYGNVYTTRQLLQLLLRCTEAFRPIEDRWVEADRVIDPFRPGLRYYAQTEREFDLLTAQHLAATRRAFAAADVFVFTLGLTEAWFSADDGAVFPACPGTVAGTFNAARHRFVNFTAAEVRDDLAAAIGVLRSINPRVEVILTVSPIPLVATAGGGHVLPATIYSKSVLRVAAGEVAAQQDRVSYFPAYEIITGPQAPRDFFQEDRRSVTTAGVDAVMEAFFANAGSGDAVVASSTAAANTSEAVEKLAATIAALECEEAFADAPTAPPVAQSASVPLVVTLSPPNPRFHTVGIDPTPATVPNQHPLVIGGILLPNAGLRVVSLRAERNGHASVQGALGGASPQLAAKLGDMPAAKTARFSVSLGAALAGARWRLVVTLSDKSKHTIAVVDTTTPAK